MSEKQIQEQTSPEATQNNTGTTSQVLYTCRLTGEKYPVDEKYMLLPPDGEFKPAALQADMKAIKRFGLTPQQLEALAEFRLGGAVSPEIGRLFEEKRDRLSFFQVMSQGKALKLKQKIPFPELGADFWFVTKPGDLTTGGEIFSPDSGKAHKALKRCGISYGIVQGLRYAEAIGAVISPVVSKAWQEAPASEVLAQFSEHGGHLNRFFDAKRSKWLIDLFKKLQLDRARLDLVFQTDLFRMLQIPKGSPLAEEIKPLFLNLPKQEDQEACRCCGTHVGTVKIGGGAHVDPEGEAVCGACAKSLDPDRTFLTPMGEEQVQLMAQSAQSFTSGSVTLGDKVDFGELKIGIQAKTTGEQRQEEQNDEAGEL